MIEDAIAGLRSDEQREGRVYGFVTGRVTDASDPKSLGRVKARLIGQGQNETTDWLQPFWSGAIEGVAQKDDEIIIGFIDGDPHLGFFGLSPTSKTGKRPSEAVVLGNAAWAMINNLAAQFNQLRTDFNTFAGVYSSHTHPAGTPNTGTPSATQTSTSASAAQKGKAADGSEVAAKSTSEIVLSGRAKVGK